MVAGTWNFTIEQGATFAKTITVRKNGALLDLTGCTATMQVRPAINSSTVIFELSNGNGFTLGGVDGTIEAFISAIATAALDFERAVHNLEIRDSGGVVVRLLTGTVCLSREVTR